MVKSSCSDNSGLRKGAWSPEEDKKLTAYIKRYGHWNWNVLPKFAGLERSGKSCRLRWLNYLRPNIKRGNYTQEEDETIIKLHQLLGNRWSAIAAELPGRTDNEIKNYWHTNLKKRYQHNSETCAKAQISHSKDQSPVEEMATTAIDIAPFQSLPSTCQSTDSSTSEFSITPDHIHSIADSNQYFVPEDEFAFLDAYQEDPLNGSFWLESNLADISTVPCEILAAEPHCFSPVRDVQLWTHDSHYGA